MSKAEQDKKISKDISDVAEAKAPEDLTDEDLEKVAGGVAAGVFPQVEVGIGRRKVLDGKTDRRSVS